MSTEYLVILAVLVPSFWFLFWIILALEREIRRLRLQSHTHAAATVICRPENKFIPPRQHWGLSA